jgi:hypothetical protein
VQISPSGGQEPVWSRDGQQIFYRTGRQLVAAKIAASPKTLEVLDRRVLFEGAYMPDLPGRNYDVAPDDKHFLMLQPTDRDVETVVVYGWGNQLRRIWRN